jgi:hypothetical protein
VLSSDEIAHRLEERIRRESYLGPLLPDIGTGALFVGHANRLRFRVRRSRAVPRLYATYAYGTITDAALGREIAISFGPHPVARLLLRTQYVLAGVLLLGALVAAWQNPTLILGLAMVLLLMGWYLLRRQSSEEERDALTRFVVDAVNGQIARPLNA